MGLLGSIKKLFAPPKHVLRYDDLEAGQVVVEGTVRLGDNEPLSSPIKGQPCVGFFYTAVHQTPNRQAGLQVRPLRSAEGFAPFELEMDGGRIAAVPQMPGSFTAADHQKLAGASYQNFQAIEQVVTARTRVRLWGVAKKKDDGWVVTYRRIEKLGTEAKKAGAAARKRKR